MRITVKQLKNLVREAVEDMKPYSDMYEEITDKEDLFQLYSDMYKEMHNIPPSLDIEEVTEDQLRALIKKLEQHYKEEAEEAAQKAKERALKKISGYENLEDLPQRSGMRKRLEETIKSIVREAVKGKQKKLDVAPPFGKLDKHDFKKLGKISKARKKENEKD